MDVLAGGCGGALAKSLLSPFQRVVVLQQLGQHQHLSSVHLVRHIYRNDGVTGFWRGNWTSMLIRMPYSGIQFVLYGKLKFWMQDWLESQKAKKMQQNSQASPGRQNKDYTSTVDAPK